MNENSQLGDDNLMTFENDGSCTESEEDTNDPEKECVKQLSKVKLNMQSFRNYLIWTKTNTVAVETVQTGWKESEPEPVLELNLKKEISLEDLLGSAPDKKMSSESSEKDSCDSDD